MTGTVHALVRDRYCSRKFIGPLDAGDLPDTAIRVMLENHSAHVFEETSAWLAKQAESRLTLKHGSPLNPIEGFFSKLASSVPRQSRVASKQEIKDRPLPAIDDISQHPIAPS